MKKAMKSSLAMLMAFLMLFTGVATTFSGIEFSFKAQAFSSVKTEAKSGTGWTLYDDGELYVTANITTSKETPAPWSDYAKDITAVSFADGVTKLTAYTFSGIKKVVKLYISEKVTEIDNDAFANFESLEKIYFGDNKETWNALYKGDGEFTVVYFHVHDKNVKKYSIIPTCKDTGYTGDLYCSVCESFVEEGREISADNSKHAWTSNKIVKSKETCCKDREVGYQCQNCSAWKDCETIADTATGKHTWELKEENKLTNCENDIDKTVTYTCTADGCKATKPVIITGHSLEYTVVEPTCTKGGYTNVKCIYCTSEFEIRDKVGALGHKATEYFYNAATCTEPGSYGYKCQRCKAICEETPIKAKGHQDGEWVVVEKATCEKDGLKKLKCANCEEYIKDGEGADKTEIIPNFHTEGYRDVTYELKREATCKNDGYYILKCNICEKYVKDDKGNDVTVAIPQDGSSHKASDWILIEKATCEKAGLMVKKCTVTGCPYCSDGEIGKAVAKSADDTVVKAIVKFINEEDNGTKLVNTLNNNILTCYYKSEFLDNGQIASDKIKTWISSLAEIETISDKKLANEIIAKVAEKISADTLNEVAKSVTYTKNDIIAYCKESFSEIGSKWIETAMQDSKNAEELATFTNFCLDTKEIPATGHNYEIPRYTKEDVENDKTGAAVEGRIKADYLTTYGVDCTEGGELVKICSYCEKQEKTPVNKGNHKFVVKTVEPTCEKKGYTLETCEYCTYENVYAPTAAAEHKWNEKVIVDSTCSVSGLKVKQCTVCEKIDLSTYKEVAKKAHKNENEVVAPTCVDAGYTRHTCTVCGFSYNDTEVAPKGHDYKHETIEKSCTVDGYILHTCKVCKYAYKDSYDIARGHQYGDPVEVDATCEEDSYILKVCQVCKNELKTGDGRQTRTNHNWVDDEAVAATCQSTGLTAGRHCTKCKVTDPAQEVVPMLEHTVVVDEAVAAGCTTSGLTEGSHCSVCKTVFVAQQYIPAKSHSMVYEPAVEATCTRAGHTAGSYCKACNTVFEAKMVIPQKEHTLTSEYIVKEATAFESGTKAKACLVCNQEFEFSYELAFFEKIGWLFNYLFGWIGELFFGTSNS